MEQLESLIQRILNAVAESMSTLDQIQLTQGIIIKENGSLSLSGN